MQQSIQLKEEQDYVNQLFQRLDAEVELANERLNAVLLDVDPHNPDPDALVRRETEYHAVHAKLDRLALAQLGLVFGRIDIDAPGDNPTAEGLDRRYIGRMGMDDRADDYRTLLLDWRAPMARAFYLATTAQPEGVQMRRHIRTRGRKVTDIHDEYLGGAAHLGGTAQDAGKEANVASESALHAALQRARSRHMSSIVETIQREQDEIIRDTTRGVMVVEGGPGTGKTAVALHRIAYLLYNHREQLSATGVLIIGPNSTFLDYISRVLPELGETGVVLSTIGNLFPGISPQFEESLLGREIKGSEAMVDILRKAVQDYQHVPHAPIELRVDSLDVEITPAMVKAARTRARRSRKPHNDARGIFNEHVTEQLAKAIAEKIGQDPLGGRNLLSRADVDQIHDDLLEDTNVAQQLDNLWPLLNPADVLSNLLSSKDAITSAAYDYDEETQQALWRPDGAAWTPSDAALLDELAVIIGMPDPHAVAQAEEEQWREQLAEAEQALDILASSESTDNDDDLFDAEILSAHDVIDAETLARRQQVRDHRTTAQRAAQDYTWAYGHIIVDEAQELTPMEWRMLFRRSPSRWMTLVGDTMQTGAPAGVDSWADTLGPFVQDRFRHHQLTVNYRTPQYIAEFADHIAKIIDPNSTPATALRAGQEVEFVDLPEPNQCPQPGIFNDASGRLHAVISQENVDEIKGLEFDHVTVVAPQDIVDSSPQGWQNLYVAVTRATQTLKVLGPLPGNLSETLQGTLE